MPQDRSGFWESFLGGIGALGQGEVEASVVVPVETPITDLAARAKTGLVQLVWSNQSEVMRYDVYRTSEYSPFVFEKIGETNSAYSTYLDLGLANDVTYLYKVYAVYGDQSLESQVVSARPPSSRIVRNYPPVFYTQPVMFGMATFAYACTAHATDPNADALTYSLAAAPDAMTIDPESGAISWTPPGPSGGSYAVSVTASDGKGGAATQRFTIVVLDEPPTAKITGESSRWVTVGETVQLDGSGSTDPDGDPLNYQWWYEAQEGEGGVFSDPKSMITTFQPLSVGSYIVSLVVNDGQVWSNFDSTYVFAHPVPPEVSMSAAPASIMFGDSATLTWNASNADSCVIEPDIGTVASSGSIAVSPGETTTYTITASSSWESWSARATAQSTIVVTYPAPTVSISANPTTIQAGQSTTLAWSSTNADTVSIEPGIGYVAASGSITVTPGQATTYIVTATSRGGTVTAGAAVIVTYLAPTVSISANPTTVQAGQPVTLAWSSANADTVSIEPGIGSVALSGSITVTPAQTTTYSITASGPGGTKTTGATVTVTYPTPTVTLSADRQTIQAGQSAMLNWSSANADSVSIEPGIGSVAQSGSMTVSPSQTTTYTITASGRGGTATAAVVVTVTHISLQIASPLEGEWISGRRVTVEGNIVFSPGSEIGVTVNGFVAQIYGNEFVVNDVPLEEGENTISAVGKDAQGNSATASVDVSAETSGNSLRILATRESATSPMETILRLDGTFTIENASLTYTGPAVAEFLDNPNTNEYRYKMTQEGLYIFTAEAVDNLGYTRQSKVGVRVLNRDDLDAFLRAKWAAMKNALITQDIPLALSYFAEESRDRYGEIFAQLGDRLSQMTGEMRDIQMIKMEDNVAEYRITKDEIFQGQTYAIAYHVYFVLDRDGLWKIYRY